VELAQEVDLAELASRKPCFVGADLANVVNDATLHAAELGKPAIGMADFAGVIDRAMTGIEHRSRVMNEQEKRIIAHHESGHALVAQSRAHCDPVKEVSIIPRGVATLGSVSAGDDPLIRRTPRLTQDAKLTRDDADSVNWQRGVTMATRIYRAANCILIFDIR
jgi:ATP-dependent Zn protease